MLLATRKTMNQYESVTGINIDPDRSDLQFCLPVPGSHKLISRCCYRSSIRESSDGDGRSKSNCIFMGRILTLCLLPCMNNSWVKEEHTAGLTLMEDFTVKDLEYFWTTCLVKESIKWSIYWRISRLTISYYEIPVDDWWQKQKCSVLNRRTGTGSKTCSFNINKVANQAVEGILNISNK